jgi:uncharacterized protein (TIGR02246 family)
LVWSHPAAKVLWGDLPYDPTMTQAEALALVAEVEAAWNSHDMERFASLFAVDADFVNVRGWWWRGREEIQKNHATLHRTSFKESTMDLELSGVKEVAPAVVVLHVKWRMTGHGASGVDLTAEPRNGIWSWVALDRDGSFQIASSHNTDTLPAPPDHPLANPSPR